MLSLDPILSELLAKMKSKVNWLSKKLSEVRTGRATSSLVESIMVDSYSNMVPLKQVASISTPDAQTITIQPWEPPMTAVIEKAILASDLGLNPNNDGKMIRVTVPMLTEERRKELCRYLRKISEDTKQQARSIRREGIEKLKSFEKNKEVSADISKVAQDKIQKSLDSSIKEIDEITAAKEKEILDLG